MNRTEQGGEENLQEKKRISASSERVAFVVVLQLVFIVLPQLAVPELPVHCAVFPHVNNVLVIFIVIVVIVFAPQASDVDQLVLETASGGAGRPAVGRRGSRAVTAPKPSRAQLLVPARGEVGLFAL